MKDKTESDPRYRPRRLSCEKCALTLGWITRNKNRELKLHVLRNAEAISAQMPELTKYSAWSALNLVGGVDVPCSSCGQIGYGWHLDDIVMINLLRKIGKDGAVEDFRRLQKVQKTTEELLAQWKPCLRKIKTKKRFVELEGEGE
jgi:hypothetical protein